MHKVEKVLIGLILLCVCIGAAHSIRHSLIAIRYPFQLDYGEGILLNQTRILAQGKNIYWSSLTDYPYLVASYPPVYAAIWTLGNHVWGLSYAVGRAVTLVAALLSAIFISLTINKITEDKLASILSGMLFLISPYVFFWSSLARVDLTALALCLAAILTSVTWSQSRWSPFVSAVLMIAAVFTRQTYLLAGPMAITGWYFHHSRRQAFIFGVVVVGGMLVVFGTLNTLTNSGFLLHTVAAHGVEFSLARLSSYLVNFATISWLFLGVAIAELISTSRYPRRTSILLSLFFVGSFVSALTVGKLGSEVNYLLELQASLALAVGAVISRWRRLHSELRQRTILFALLLLQIIWQLAYTCVQFDPVALGLQMQSEIGKLDHLVKEDHGPILADQHTGMLVMNGHDLLLDTFAMFSLARVGRWDQRPLISDILMQRFTMILIADKPPYSQTLARERWTPESLVAIRKAYEPTQILAGTTVYRPRIKESRRSTHAVGAY